MSFVPKFFNLMLSCFHNSMVLSCISLFEVILCIEDVLSGELIQRMVLTGKNELVG